MESYEGPFFLLLWYSFYQRICTSGRMSTLLSTGPSVITGYALLEGHCSSGVRPALVPAVQGSWRDPLLLSSPQEHLMEEVAALAWISNHLGWL
jgi:hypothetical protein